jgi:voltage-gated potassium channel
MFHFHSVRHNYRYFKTIYLGVAFILAVLLTGILGYMGIEDYPLLDAIFMTVITVATVGYREVHELSDAGKIFTTLLIFFSIGTFAYAISVITRYVIEGEFQTYFKHYRVNKEIQKLDNHIIVCGYGRNGMQACAQLGSQDEKFVAIEMNPDIIASMRDEENILFIEGDATKDETLEEAGIEKAKALISALPDDASNVFVVLTARGINPNLKIISRASDEGSEIKLKRAGADNVIMPDKIGGTHMASLVVKPDVLEFLDFITERVNIKLEEILFSKLPENMQNKSIKELEIRNRTGANIIGIKTAEGNYMINPSPDTIMKPGAKLFVLGTKDQVSKFKQIISI